MVLIYSQNYAKFTNNFRILLKEIYPWEVTPHSPFPRPLYFLSLYIWLFNVFLINVFLYDLFWLFSFPYHNSFIHAVACAAAAAKSLQSCPTLCDPIDGSHQAPLSLGFSRQEHWSGLPFPPPVGESESEVTQSCPTLSDPMDCSLPGSSIHGIFQARVLEWGAIAFSAIANSRRW